MTRSAEIQAARTIVRSGMGTCVLLAPCLSLFLLVSILGESQWSTASMVALAFPLGILAADFLSGFVHWACDTWGDERTPWVGDGLIRSFREHHSDPEAMCDHDWIEVNGQAAVPVTLAFCGLCSLEMSEATPFLKPFLWSALTFAGLTNQLHQWAHRPEPSAMVRCLQRMGLILSPTAHDAHHCGSHDRGFCVSTGWLNPLLDRVEFWRRLENQLRSVPRLIRRSSKRAL